MYILIFRLKSYQNFTLLKNSTLYHIQQADESRTVEQKVKHTYLSVYQELNNSVNDEELPSVCGIPHGVAELPTPIPKQVKQTVSQISSQQGTFVLHYTIPNIHISDTYICTCTKKPRNTCRGLHTWGIADELANKATEVEANVLQVWEVSVTLTLQILAGSIYVLHKRLVQTMLILIYHSRVSETANNQ